MIEVTQPRRLRVPRGPQMLARFIGAIALFAGIPDHALAYIGPGSGITLIGALWAVVLAILLAIGGLFWWPLRALLRKRRRAAAQVDSAHAAAGDQPERPSNS